MTRKQSHNARERVSDASWGPLRTPIFQNFPLAGSIGGGPLGRPPAPPSRGQGEILWGFPPFQDAIFTRREHRFPPLLSLNIEINYLFGLSQLFFWHINIIFLNLTYAKKIDYFPAINRGQWFNQLHPKCIKQWSQCIAAHLWALSLPKKRSIRQPRRTTPPFHLIPPERTAARI